MNPLTIGHLAHATGTKTETIRYYEKIGLLPRPRRTAGNYRSYGEEHVQRLGFIRRARDLGFSIDDVRELLTLAAHREQSCDNVDEIAARHLAATERKIAALTRLRRELGKMLASCHGGEISECRVIQSLSQDQRSRPAA
ncbi:MAG TPA: helix-turn-helix domain-containing protein [Bauldia sp.]|nr:helix-turn-helix domain-containing protein [Bauldia sp.]